MNIVLGIISIIFVYTSTILMDKFLKKEGLIVWITFATITANILVCKNIDIFNLTVSLGNIMFASNFLATDILSEKYSKDYASLFFSPNSSNTSGKSCTSFIYALLTSAFSHLVSIYHTSS